MDRSTDSTVSRRRRSESISLGGCNGGPHAPPDRVTMMPRFRPIAPKPVTGVDTLAVDGSDVAGMRKNDFVLYDKRRPKRKYDKTRRRALTAAVKKKKIKVEEDEEEEEESGRNYKSDVQTERQLAAGETLRPVHVSTKRDDPSIFNSINNIDVDTKISGHLPCYNYFQQFLLTCSSTGTDSALRSVSVTPEQCFRLREFSDDAIGPYGLSLFKIPDSGHRVESCSRVVVVVERVVSNIYNGVEVDALELGRTDSEKMKTLDGDTLPGFVSDSENKVVWVNRVFEAMICGGGSKETAVNNDLAPELVVRDLPETCCAFSCHVKVRRHGKPRGGGGGAKEKYDTIPCDVWRMETGGFAWRLDVKTALTLASCYSTA